MTVIDKDIKKHQARLNLLQSALNEFEQEPLESLRSPFSMENIDTDYNASISQKDTPIGKVANSNK